MLISGWRYVCMPSLINGLYLQTMIRKPNNAIGQKWRRINSMIDTTCTSYLSYQKFKLLHMRMSTALICVFLIGSDIRCCSSEVFCSLWYMRFTYRWPIKERLSLYEKNLSPKFWIDHGSARARCRASQIRKSWVFKKRKKKRVPTPAWRPRYSAK